jgi:eukaryotic-like serine/threonine-protein kinase
MTGAIAKGAVLSRKFRVDGVLGEGGMGVVLAATHIVLEQRVALKFLHEEAAQNPEVKARFLQEARAAAKLKSEHIARVMDVQTLDDGSPFIVSELLDGMDLEELIKARGPLPPELAADYVLQACVGMAEAHAQGIVHRDLKPANLFLTKTPAGRPLVKILDFGIAKAPAGSFDLSQTNSGAVFGSPAFMSPEQMRSAKDVDARADIWAFGAILQFLLTGWRPFQATSFPELCAKVLGEAPDLPEDAAPEPLRKIILSCLEKDREARMPTLSALASELAPHCPARGALYRSAIDELLGASAFAETGYADGADPSSKRDPSDRPAVKHDLVSHGTTLRSSAAESTERNGGARRRFPRALAWIAGVAAAAALAGLFSSSATRAPAGADRQDARRGAAAVGGGEVTEPGRDSGTREVHGAVAAESPASVDAPWGPPRPPELAGTAGQNVEDVEELEPAAPRATRATRRAGRGDSAPARAGAAPRESSQPPVADDAPERPVIDWTQQRRH